MKVKASGMERMFGMSPNGIRLYEKQGVIRPQREESGYRTYGVTELLAMGFGVQYRRYGFTLPQTASLMDGGDAAEQLSALRTRTDEMELEIERMMRERKSLKTQIARAERAQRLMDACETDVKPAMYFLATRRDEQFVCGDADALIGGWVERYAPHLSAALLLDGPYMTREDFDRTPLSGAAVDAEVALELGLMPSQHMTYLPPKRCVVTGVRMEDAHADLSGPVARVRGYAQAQGIGLQGGGMIRWLQCLREGDTLVTTGLLYAPLLEDEARAGEMK